MDEEERKELVKKAEQRGFIKGTLLVGFAWIFNILIRFIFEFWGK